MILSKHDKFAILAGALVVLTSFSVLNIEDELASSLKPSYQVSRSLSVDHGNGNCTYETPAHDVESLDLYKYLLVGFPSGDKRMAYIQMEALTGLPSKDEWDFVFNGYSNAPFIKTNYPHPASTWSWGSEANEVAMVVQFIRRSLVEYSDIAWYQSGAADYNSQRHRVENEYGRRMATNDWYNWRDERVLEDIYRYGSYIDYWMENGERRDPITHQYVDQEYWELLTKPIPISSMADEVHICKKTNSTTNPTIDMTISSQKLDVYLEHGDYYGICEDAKLDKSWWDRAPVTYTAVRDPHCQNIYPYRCSPRIVISVDKLRDPSTGPNETALLAKFLQQRGLAKYVINESTWPCIWTTIIKEGKGPKSFNPRKKAEEPGFSAFFLKEMIYEISRLITKYSAAAWVNTNTRAVRLVSLFTEHLELLNTELEEVESGVRYLTVSDYLGPNQRN